MSKERLGANGVWPRVPTFPDSPPRPAGIPRGDHIALDEHDERILDKVWAEVIGTAPAEAHAADGRAAPGDSAPRQNGAAAGTAKQSRKPAPAVS
jgi:hypothetical protein